ncbi:RNA polymerase, sigma-24 subunit, ECF subfamily [Kribbella flavida DSM 17836]|uniref:RNA polymerase, sigma-24 subunit, ECF subfamily n=1 Tax=Kribbella flavida (strain DSM 17836 / JCM 10339 / NBRC 14399) TaxID=479435 RepID=D2PVZ1_KRIFD|nr:sigma-70 family RNA polymerase sigma factor [Kribbella flavida]ADB29648.1 RNA polymerase, sigma-24 subunit, ECF subfamily [Kribbella flavida DSM 17836]
MNLEDEFAQYRSGLLAHCYRMLGSLHDAEDAVQETYLRAWKGMAAFEGRSSVKTWLYRIATNVCLSALQHSSRRVIPSALGAPGNDPDNLEAQALETSWLEPWPDLLDPALVVGNRQTLRLAMVAALQHLPARQRAVLILREVLAWPAAEVADLLDTTTAAVNSALQRARAELARLSPAEEQFSEPDEPVRRALLDQYAVAFEQGDLVALEGLLTADTRWEMPPIPTWFSGRDDVLRLLAAKLPPGAGKRLMVETGANGQPAFAVYLRGRDGAFHGYAIQVLELNKAGISGVLAFHRPDLFPLFGLPVTRLPEA